MDRNKLFILISAAFIALFFICYFAGWFLDKNFRQTMRRTKLTSAQKIFLHFRGTGKNKDRGHTISCIRLEKYSFVNIPVGAVIFAASRFYKGTALLLLAMLLLLASAGFFGFNIFTDLMKHIDRKHIIDEMDETGFEDYRIDEKTPYSAVRVPNPENYDASFTEDTTSLTDKIKEIKSKGLLDDDIFSPFVSDVTDKFRGVRAESGFADGDSIEAGKEALKNLAENQLKAEQFSGTNHFTGNKNSYEKNKDTADKSDEFSIRRVIDEHKKELDPETQMRGVNKNSRPVGKDDTQ